MYLLYADESGALTDPNQDYFILAGVAIFERHTHWVEQDLIDIAKRFTDDPFEIEFHGSPMRSGREDWRSVSVDDRLTAAKDVLAVCKKRKLKIFASVINKSQASGIDILESSFEQVSSRFDMFLKRCYRKNNQRQRGLMILDKSSTEIQIQNLSRSFKFDGHTWGQLKNFSEVPLFIDSKASKLMQLADMIAFALKRYYANDDDILFNEIKECFDSDGGTVHGLYKNF